jgi:hypothetical protein
VSDVELERLDRERGLVSRSAWIRSRLFGERELGAVAVSPSPARSATAPELAQAVPGRDVDFSEPPALSPLQVPGVVRGSSLVKRGVRPIPKGKGQ